jgi:hypothetical protein
MRARSLTGTEEIAMDAKTLIRASVVVLVIFGLHHGIVQAGDHGEGIKDIRSTETGTFVSTNFDFDHADLSTPANYVNGAGSSNAGNFISQGVNEFKADGNKCTVPGGASDAGTELALVGSTTVTRFSAHGDLLFYKTTVATACQDFSTFPNPPFPFIDIEKGNIIGGTGAFAGATGTFEVDVKGATLSIDATEARILGWFEAKGETILTHPVHIH